jgi:hypothetical protein
VLESKGVIEVSDDRVAEAFARELNHPAPFSREEVATIEAVYIQYARDISALSACTALRRLIIRQSEIHELSAVRGLPTLAMVRADCNSLRDISALRDISTLTGVTFHANLIEDISPLLGLDLLSVTLFGNPLNEESQKVTLKKLRKRRDPPLVKADSDADWELTRALQARGWDAVFWRDDQTLDSHVVRPGLRHGPRPEADAIPITAEQLRKELDRSDVTYDQLIERYKTGR